MTTKEPALSYNPFNFGNVQGCDASIIHVIDGVKFYFTDYTGLVESKKRGPFVVEIAWYLQYGSWAPPGCVLIHSFVMLKCSNGKCYTTEKDEGGISAYESDCGNPDFVLKHNNTIKQRYITKLILRKSIPYSSLLYLGDLLTFFNNPTSVQQWVKNKNCHVYCCAIWICLFGDNYSDVLEALKKFESCLSKIEEIIFELDCIPSVSAFNHAKLYHHAVKMTVERE